MTHQCAVGEDNVTDPIVEYTK